MKVFFGQSKISNEQMSMFFTKLLQFSDKFCINLLHNKSENNYTLILLSFSVSTLRFFEIAWFILFQNVWLVWQLTKKERKQPRAGSTKIKLVQ